MIVTDSFPINANKKTNLFTSLMVMSYQSDILITEDLVKIFRNKKYMGARSKVLDRYLKQFFRTPYVVSVINEKQDIRFPMGVETGPLSNKISTNHMFEVLIADIFPNYKEFYLYKLQEPDTYSSIYSRYF